MIALRARLKHDVLLRLLAEPAEAHKTEEEVLPPDGAPALRGP